MDRNELSLRMEALKAAMHQHDYEKAVDIADELDLRKIRDNYFLSLVADAYEVCHEYDKSKDALLTAYENTNAGRQLAYRLCLISIKTKEFDEAQEFYEDFVEMAPRDTGRFILKYKMSKAQGATTEKLIEILEEYINLDMEEKWAYELAKLYHLSGDQEKCVDMCDEISLWFAEGKYVLKALELKKKYQPLSALQKQRYEEGKQKNLEEALAAEISKKSGKQPQEGSKTAKEVSPENIEVSTDFEAENIQEIVAEGMKDIDESEDNVSPESETEKSATEKIDIRSDDEMPEETILEEVEELEDEPAEDVVIESESEPEESKPDETPAEEIKDLGDIQDILKQLQARGILKPETVEQATTIIDEASNEENKELDKELEQIDKESEAEAAALEAQAKAAEVEEQEAADDSEAANEVEDADEPKEAEETGKTIAIPSLDEFKTENSEEVVEEQEEESKQEEPEETGEDSETDADGVPVLDLGFDAAIDAAKEQVSEVDAPDESKEDETGDLVSTDNLSAEVEVLSGPEENDSKTLDNTTEIKPEDSTEEPKEEKKADASRQGVVLSDEELSVFKNYLNVEGLESDIKETIQDLIDNYIPDGKSVEGNVIILGDKKTGKTTLAIEMIKLVNAKRGRRDRKLAKIHASALNKRGFRNSLAKLIGCDLIVEDAHELGAMTISDIIDTAGMFTDDMLMVLEGDAEGLQELIKNVPHVSEVFNHIIQIREYDIKEWVEYGKEYAKENGYVMDELASLAFYKAIDDRFGENKGISRKDVEDIMENAMSKGKKKLFGAKKDDDGLIILSEKSFR